MALGRLRRWIAPPLAAVISEIVVVPDHPELDQPEGTVQWQDWLDALCRLDLAILDLEKRERLITDAG